MPNTGFEMLSKIVVYLKLKNPLVYIRTMKIKMFGRHPICYMEYTECISFKTCYGLENFF